MAITATHCAILRSLPVPRGATILEIGQANWYGDISPEEAGLGAGGDLFDAARRFYDDWCSPSRIVSVDQQGRDSIRDDLNLPLSHSELFDVVVNHGTAEHVFNIGQVFKTIHDSCDIDGWMIHDAPLHGWIDHGFYCLQPTLFYDLAIANCYEVARVVMHESKSRQIVRINSRDHVSELYRDGKLPNNATLLVAFRKRIDQPFRVPTQAYYAGMLSEEAAAAWKAR